MTFWIVICIIVVSSLYFDFQKTKLKQEFSNKNLNEVKHQLSVLTDENDALRERLKYVEELLAQPNANINLDYEKQQIALDRQFKYDADHKF